MSNLNTTSSNKSSTDNHADTGGESGDNGVTPKRTPLQIVKAVKAQDRVHYFLVSDNLKKCWLSELDLAGTAAAACARLTAAGMITFSRSTIGRIVKKAEAWAKFEKASVALRPGWLGKN